MNASSGPFRRVSTSKPCPVCNRPDWCLVSADGTAAICPRTERDSLKYCGEAGWLHILDSSHHDLRRGRVVIPIPQRSRDFAGYARRAANRIAHAQLNELANRLGVSVDSLRSLGVGWDGTWTFPMRNAQGQIVGVRRRLVNGSKRALVGSRNGLFLPTPLSNTDPFLITEGESDCAAMLTLGFEAIGRTSCNSGTRFLIPVARSRDVTVVADSDPIGARGATALASVLAAHCSSVRVITPPKGIKDARDWLRAGATHNDLTAAIEQASPVHLRVRTLIAGDARRESSGEPTDHPA